MKFNPLARMFHELMSRDHEDELAFGQPQGIGSEAYLNGTSQEPIPEAAQKEAIFFALAALRSVPQAGSQFRGRSKRFIKHPGWK
jgi:hypothetical protein